MLLDIRLSNFCHYLERYFLNFPKYIIIFRIELQGTMDALIGSFMDFDYRYQMTILILYILEVL